MKAKKAQWASKQDEATAAQKEFDARNKELEAIKASMDSIQYKEGDMEAKQMVCFLVICDFYHKIICTGKVTTYTG